MFDEVDIKFRFPIVVNFRNHAMLHGCCKVDSKMLVSHLLSPYNFDEDFFLKLHTF